ncbi:MAG: T9SS C-terminal target domain-containing protein [Candidatus Kapaibacterium sp.]|nr:MAG: T9SS C-terminal target domain-containing protein [Candidatus Kapabacteria bacterium]
MNIFRTTLCAFLFCVASIDAVFGQDVPTLSVSVVGSNEPNGTANGAQAIPPATLLLRERRHTMAAADNGFQSGSLRITRSTSGSRAAFMVAYSLEYFVIANTSALFSTSRLSPRQVIMRLPNVGTQTLQLPAPPNVTLVPVFTPALPTPTPVVINGLQGDLSPILRASTTTQLPLAATEPNASGTIAWASVDNERVMTFTGRWSDQAWPRNPGVQGHRVAVLRLLPSPASPPAYQIAPNQDSAFVYLLDPALASPVIINPLPDVAMRRPQAGMPSEHFLELESPAWREDGIPGFVFYDDNYDPLRYTITSSDPASVSVRLLPLNLDGGTQSSVLALSVTPQAQLNARVRISISASDGTNIDPAIARFARDEFIVHVRDMLPTSVAATQAQNNEIPSIASSPNPVTDKCTVSAIVPDAGFYRLRVSDVLGNLVYTTFVEGKRGQEQAHQIDMTGFAAGTYFVEIHNGKAAGTTKIVKM